MKLRYLALLFIGFTAPSYAQTLIQRDPIIETMVQQINADSLKSHIQHLVSFGSRHTLSESKNAKQGISAARTWVVDKFKSYAHNAPGRLKAYLDTTTLQADGRRVDKNTLLGNAVAILQGTDPSDQRVFIISAHLDSRVSDIMNRNATAPGANDDGSGVAGLIEAARVMSKQSFPASIIFVALSGEEQSLLGAGFMAKQAKAKQLQIEAVLNNDMIGSNNANETNIIDNTRLRVFSEGLPIYELEKQAKNIRQYGLENDGISRQLARYVKEIGERYVDQLEVKLIYRNDRYLRGGDHSAFVEQGFAAVRLTEMNENYNHQHQDLRSEKGIVYGDLPEFMDFEYLRKNTAVNVATLANLAMSASKPQQVKIEVRKLTNFTELSWEAPAHRKAKGYYVLIRETSSPMWEKKIFTSDTKIKLPYSKDNYLFAVQSVSDAGHESLAVVPGQGR